MPTQRDADVPNQRVAEHRIIRPIWRLCCGESVGQEPVTGEHGENRLEKRLHRLCPPSLGVDGAWV